MQWAAFLSILTSLHHVVGESPYVTHMPSHTYLQAILLTPLVRVGPLGMKCRRGQQLLEQAGTSQPSSTRQLCYDPK